MSSILNVAMTFVVFGHPAQIALWEMGQAVFDLVPSAFMTAFMSSAIPGMIAEHRRKTGKIETIRGRVVRVRGNAVVRALIIAVACAILVAGIGAVIALLSGAASIPFAADLLIKVLISVAIPVAVTPFSIREVLSISRAPSTTIRRR